MATKHKETATTAIPTGSNSVRAATAQKENETKKDRLCRLLRRTRGVSMSTLQKELGWQPHTVRAAISGVRKTGEIVECRPGKAGPTYKIVEEATAQ